MPYVTQTRDIDVARFSGKSYYLGSPSTSIERVAKGKQITTSYRSGADDQRKFVANTAQFLKEYGYLPGFDTGHEFSTTRYRFIGNAPVVDYTRLQSRFVKNLYINEVAQWLFHGSGTYDSIPPWDDKIVQGNMAIKATSPTAPAADLAVSLAEYIREGNPAAIFGSLLNIRDRVDFARKLGGEYLNIQFGWAPLVSAVQQLATSVLNGKKILDQYRRDSGRVVRRSFYFPPTTTFERLRDGITLPYYTFNGGEPFQATKVYADRVTTQKVYFKGAFTYYIPEGGNFVSDFKMYESLANKLLGTRLTPEVLWNLAPWSWLSDYFVNIGNNLSVASMLSNDSLVLKYGYLMRHSIVDLAYTGSASSISGTKVPPLNQILRSERKERIRSTPYGFGLNINDLTGQQWSILAALGLTKAPRSLA